MVSEHAETCAGASVSSAAADLLLVNGTPPGRTQDWARCLTTFPRGGSVAVTCVFACHCIRARLDSNGARGLCWVDYKVDRQTETGGLTMTCGDHQV